MYDAKTKSWLVVPYLMPTAKGREACMWQETVTNIAVAHCLRNNNKAFLFSFLRIVTKRRAFSEQLVPKGHEETVTVFSNKHEGNNKIVFLARSPTA